MVNVVFVDGHFRYFCPLEDNEESVKYIAYISLDYEYMLSDGLLSDEKNKQFNELKQIYDNTEYDFSKYIDENNIKVLSPIEIAESGDKDMAVRIEPALQEMIELEKYMSDSDSDQMFFIILPEI